jgi:hypothetical protein
MAGDVVAAAANGERKLGCPRELDRRDDVGGVERPDDQRRMTGDGAVEDPAGEVEVGMRPIDDLAAKRRLQVELIVDRRRDRRIIALSKEE